MSTATGTDAVERGRLPDLDKSPDCPLRLFEERVMAAMTTLGTSRSVVPAMVSSSSRRRRAISAISSYKKNPTQTGTLYFLSMYKS